MYGVTTYYRVLNAFSFLKEVEMREVSFKVKIGPVLTIDLAIKTNKDDDAG